MVDPLLDLALHSDFFHPVDVVGSGSGVGGAGHEAVDLFLGVVIFHGNAVDIHPVDEARMIDDILFERVA